VIAIGSDGGALVQAAWSLKPDGFVVEVASPHLNELDAAEPLKHQLPSLKLVFLTAKSAVHTAAKAYRRRATACALKHSGSEEFRTIFPSVVRGESYTWPVIARNKRSPPPCAQVRNPRVVSESPGENRILQLLSGRKASAKRRNLTLHRRRSPSRNTT
jgi:DNA-binding NarL/FixJ family response regulator